MFRTGRLFSLKIADEPDTMRLRDGSDRLHAAKKTRTIKRAPTPDIGLYCGLIFLSVPSIPIFRANNGLDGNFCAHFFV